MTTRLPLPIVFSAIICLLLSGGSLDLQAANPPRTTKKPVVNDYHGVKITDDYQWLENASDPAVKAWTAAQNSYSREYLDKLPARPHIEDALKRLYAKTSANYFGLHAEAGKLFLMKFLPPAQQPVLVRLDSVTNLASEKLIFDPASFSSGKGRASVDWFVPSLDGKLIAICISENGSEDGSLHFYEVETGRKLSDIIPRVQYPTAGGSAAWNSDNTGIYYTRFPHKGERPDADLHFYQQIYFHKLGTPASQDKYEYGKEFPRIAEIELQSSPDGRQILATVSNGDGGEYAHFLKGRDGAWIQLTKFEDKVKSAEFGRDPLYVEFPKDNAIYVLSKKDAPKGKLLRVSLDNPLLSSATVVVPETTNVIAGFKPTASGIALSYMNGGPCHFAYHDFTTGRTVEPNRTGGSSRGPNFRNPTSIRQLVVLRGDEVLLRTETFVDPFTWWRFEATGDTNRLEATDLRGTSPVPFSDIEVVRAEATSKDGTKVPMTILHKKGLRLTPDTPTLLYGYGGYGISMAPNFNFTRRIWLDQDGIYVVANIRGGGELGDDWHLQGNLTRKQNVFDDFAACANYLISNGLTSSEKLAIEGGSNGGLLMAATWTQNPALMRAVVSHVGVYDMLRVELDPNGAFNVTEFGTVTKPDHFKALRSYSPYHNVRSATAYPAILMLTGEHDGRVNPAHSKKMTAKMQAATSSKNPIYLRTSSTSGHGIGTALDERVQQAADVLAFLFDQLGIEYSLVTRGPWAGGVSSNSATIKARLPREGMEAKIRISKSPELERVRGTLPQRSADTNYNLVTFNLKGLQPNSTYYYALEVAGKLQKKHMGTIKTFPAPGPASFTFSFASCSRTGSTNSVFDRIREHQPLFHMNMGDLHYQDIRTNDINLFRSAYDSVLGSPPQRDLYRSTPLVYVWDDHDFGGNNSNRRSASGEAAFSAYEEYVPHYPLGTDDGAIYHSFSVGRVKIIMNDLRSDRDNPRDPDGPSKTLMGKKQKEWFKQELLNSNGKFPLILWVTSVPYIGEAGKPIYGTVRSNEFGWFHHTNLVDRTERSRRNSGGGDEDHWSVFAHERREIADFIKANNIKGVAILHGDSHMLAADDGSHSDYATGGGVPIPVMCAGPLDQSASLKGGPYSQGVYRTRPGEGCFGLLTVDDKGSIINVTYSGRNNRDEEKVSLKFSVPANGSK